jgi:hypothetical protein
MFTVVADAAALLREALVALDGVSHVEHFGVNPDPPATLLGPPSLQWGSFDSEPTAARFLVYLVVPAQETSLEEMWALLPLVTNAIDGVRDAVVVRADPGRWATGVAGTGGAIDLPSYEIQVEVSLR